MSRGQGPLCSCRVHAHPLLSIISFLFFNIIVAKPTDIDIYHVCRYVPSNIYFFLLTTPPERTAQTAPATRAGGPSSRCSRREAPRTSSLYYNWQPTDRPTDRPSVRPCMRLSQQRLYGPCQYDITQQCTEGVMSVINKLTYAHI